MRYVRQEKRKIRLKSRTSAVDSSHHVNNNNNNNNSNTQSTRNMKQLYRNQLSSHQINENYAETSTPKNNVTFFIENNLANTINKPTSPPLNHDQLILYRNFYYRELNFLQKKDNKMNDFEKIAEEIVRNCNRIAEKKIEIELKESHETRTNDHHKQGIHINDDKNTGSDNKKHKNKKAVDFI